MKKYSKYIGATSVVALLCGGAVSAQELVLDEIVITAQKREEGMQDVGIAVTAFSGSQIEKLGFQTTTDIVFQTPGLQLYEFSPNITVYNMRGVSQNSFNDNLEGPVAVYFDDAYASALGSQNQPVFDMERIEILKGPQGTLYGRNATGGLIHYVSRKPTEEFEASVIASYGSYDYREIEGAISGPITDGIRARLAVVDIQEDGYLRSTNPNVRDAYGRNVTAVKAFVEADIGESGTLLLNPYYSKDTDVPTGAYVRRGAQQDPVTGLGIATDFPDNVFEHSSDVEGRFDREIYGGTAKLELPVNDNILFTSVTNYFEMDKSYLEDAEGRNLTIGDIFGTPPFGPGSDSFAPLGVFAFSTAQEFDQFSQEIRLSGSGENFSWQAGGFYLDIEQDNNSIVEGLAAVWFNPESGGLTTQAVNDFSLSAESISLFFQGEYQVSERLKLIGGFRWVRDEKQFNAFARYQEADGTVLNRGADGEIQAVIDPNLDGGFIAPICYSVDVDSRCAADLADPDARFEYSDWAGKLQLDFAVNDDLLIYAGINRGTKGGNWASPAFPDSIRANGLDSLAHIEETLLSYEAGFKSTIADGRGRINAAVFYYDYQDYQAFSLINFVQNITNNDAEVLGAEIEVAYSPMAGLDLLLGGSFLDTTVEDIVTPFGVALDTELPNAPAVSLNGLVRYAWNVGGGEASLQVDGNYNSSQFLEVTNPGSAFEEAYFAGNFRAAYAPNDQWELAFWIRNFTDSEFRIYSLDVSGAPAPFINDVFARPRTFGGTITFKY